MPSLSVNSFELHWDVLTTKQRKSLLAQLDSFVAGRAIVRKHATKNVAPLLAKRAKSAVVSMKNKNAVKAKSIPESPSRRGSYWSGPSGSSESDTGVFHHSPPKVGSDGVGRHGRSIYPREAIEILLEQARKETS